MKLHELTREQQTFAEDNHNLIHAFLRDKQLGMDDYYDVVIFGYLRAVQKYLIREDQRQQYAFSTIAWRAMECDLGRHFKAQSCPKRRAVTVSLEAMADRNDWLTMAEIIPDTQDMIERLEAALLWDEITARLSEEQNRILRLIADGYSTREIASRQRRRRVEVEYILADIRAVALSLCFV